MLVLVRYFFFETLAQGLTGPFESLAQSGFIDVELFRCIAATEGLVVARTESEFESLGQTRAAVGEAIKNGRLVRFPVVQCFFESEKRCLVHGDLAAGTSARFAPLVASDTAEPCGDVTGHIEFIDVIPSGDESVLHEFRRVARIAGDDAGIRTEGGVVLAHELGEIIVRHGGGGELGSCSYHGRSLMIVMGNRKCDRKEKISSPKNHLDCLGNVYYLPPCGKSCRAHAPRSLSRAKSLAMFRDLRRALSISYAPPDVGHP